MKRKLLIAVASCLLSAPAIAQPAGEASIGYGLGLPGGSLRDHSSALHSLNLRAAYLLPKTEGRLSAGLEFSTGTYASFTRKQEFVFGNAAPSPFDVTYSSNVSSLNASVRFEALRIGGIGLWAGVKGGGTKFKSGFTIADPEDSDGCEPLESEKLARDFALQGGAEAGVNVDLAMFSKSMAKDQILVQFRAGLLRGGAVDYINVRATEDSRHHNHTSVNDGSTPVNVRFVNVGTGIEHQHEVARMHTSPVNYLDCGVSVVVRLD
jgi:hypothetical protein